MASRINERMKAAPKRAAFLFFREWIGYAWRLISG
jgi:hypothetical protein